MLSPNYSPLLASFPLASVNALAYIEEDACLDIAGHKWFLGSHNQNVLMLHLTEEEVYPYYIAAGVTKYKQRIREVEKG